MGIIIFIPLFFIPSFVMNLLKLRYADEKERQAIKDTFKKNIYLMIMMEAVAVMTILLMLK